MHNRKLVAINFWLCKFPIPIKNLYYLDMKKILILTLLLVSYSAFSQKKLQPFKNGDKVIFAGNSITENGFYIMYIWQYYMLHFPERKITMLNGGVGGDVAGQILDRLDDDILAKKPTVVALTFGMNDSRYFEYNNKPEDELRKEAVATSYASYLKIEKKLQAVPGMQKIIMASSPYDGTVTGPKDNFHGKPKTMLEIADFQEVAAKNNNWGFVDLMRPMTVINEREQKKDPKFTLTGTDRIHPGNAGHFAMAWLFLKAQGLTGTVVADVDINATKGKLVKALNSKVTNLKSTTTKLSFDYKANSLPFPTDTISRVWESTQKQSDALKVIPFEDEFNKELLTVTGLKPNNQYILSIDGQKINQWNGAAFAKGINLAVLSNTPQYKQALKVAELTLQHRELEQKIRSYYWLQYNYLRKINMYLQDTEVALDSVNAAAANNWAVNFKKENYQQARKKEVRDEWEKEMATLIDKMYLINQPSKHKVIIELVK